MKKVLHTLEYSLPILAGYTIRSKYIIENQKKEGFDPVVITSPLHGKTDQSYKNPEIIDDVRYFRTGYFNTLDMSEPLPLRLLRRYVYSRGYLKGIKWVAGHEKADIIHAHSSYLNGVRGTAAGRALKIPTVYEVRGLWQDTATATLDIDTHHWKYRFIDYMDVKAMKDAHRVVAISQQLKNDLMVKGIKEEKIFIVPNGVDTQLFSPRLKKPELIRKYGLVGTTVFGFIGSIRKIEGLGLFLKRFNELFQKNGNIRVMYIGDGEEEVKELKSIVRQNGLEDKVIFTGRVAHDQILDYYAVIDIFLYPRINCKVNQKVTPLKPLEAMAMGKAVVASDVGGLKELVVDEKTGLLFRADDGAHLIQRCRDLLEHPELIHKLGDQARRWTIKERDWASVIKRYHDVYERLA